MPRLIDADALYKMLTLEADDYRGLGRFERARGLESALWAIAQAPTVDMWKEGMPELEGDYLVTDGREVPWRCRMMKIGETRGWVNGALNPAVKYWMPLPPLPTENP